MKQTFVFNIPSFLNKAISEVVSSLITVAIPFDDSEGMIAEFEGQEHSAYMRDGWLLVIYFESSNRKVTTCCLGLVSDSIYRLFQPFAFNEATPLLKAGNLNETSNEYEVLVLPTISNRSETYYDMVSASPLNM